MASETKERIELAKKYEKPGYKSKKFLAFIFMELVLGFIAVYALNKQPGLGWPLSMFMVCIIVTMGSIALVFNGKQAQLDMYIRGMALTGTSNMKKGFIDKLFNTNGKADNEDKNEDHTDEH